MSQRIFDHYVIKDRLKDGHPLASGDWRVILHGIPCMATRHSHPLVLPAFVRSVPFGGLMPVGIVYCMGIRISMESALHKRGWAGLGI